MAIFIETDELTEAVYALEMALEQVTQVFQNTYRWKWFTVALHNSLQGFMVCALKGSNRLNVIKRKDAAKWLKTYEGGQQLPRNERLDLDTFLNLYEKTKSSLMHIYGYSRAYEPTGNVDWSVKRLNLLRNEFTHFLPKSWALGVRGLPKIGMDCVGLIKFLAFECGNILWCNNEALKLRCRSALEDMVRRLGELQELYQRETTS
jgi:hypothetical protein